MIITITIWLSSFTHAKSASIQINTAEELKRFTSEKDITKLDSLEINCFLTKEEAKELFTKLLTIKQIDYLCLDNNSLREFPEELYKLHLIELVVRNNPQIDFTKFYKRLSNYSYPSRLQINANGINCIPKKGILLKNITALSITGNTSMALDYLIEVVSTYPKLKTLNLSNNNLMVIPDNIKLLDKIEELNLSENYITELIPELGQLRNLKTLILKNISLINEVEELNKLKNTSIQDIYADSDLNSDEKKSLEKELQPCKLHFSEDNNQNLSIEDTSAQKTSFNPISAQVDSIVFGTLEVNTNFRIYSDAYLRYPTFFRDVSNNFDSLLFEERFRDTTYSNGWKIKNRKYYASFSLGRDIERPGKKGEKWFHLPNTSLIVTTYPELMAFMGMYWVYNGELSYKKFKQTFIKNRIYTDIRLLYNDASKEFEIQLKDLHGFTSFKAYPKTIRELPVEKMQKEYVKKYYQYTKVLTKRAQKFDRYITKIKSRYYIAYRIRQENAWTQLRSVMSDHEKKMTREEWLTYYDKVIAEETSSLSNAVATQYHFNKSLLLLNYTRINLLPSTSIDQNNVNVLPLFKDIEDKGLAVKYIYVINNNDKLFSFYMGTLNSKGTPLSINSKTDCIVIELRNGNLAYITNDQIKKIRLRDKKACEFKMILTDKNLNTVGELLSTLKLN